MVGGDIKKQLHAPLIYKLNTVFNRDKINLATMKVVDGTTTLFENDFYLANNTQFPNFALGQIIIHLAPERIKKFV